MKKKARKKSDTQKFKTTLEQFKNAVETRLGQINWKKVGVYSLAILFIVAMSGLLGPKPQLLSRALFKYAVLV